MGDLIPVKLLEIDNQGRFKLSRKAALAELGQDSEKKPAEGDAKKVLEGKR
jgi:predicted RNA-binding protein with RPS1 domain